MKISRIRRDVYRKGKRRCHWCGVRLSLMNGDERPMTIDHVIPKSKGGKDTLRNFVPACGPCNHRRGNMDYDEFCRSHRAGIVIRKIE